MRNACLYVAVLLVAACESGFEPLDPVIPEVRFTLNLQSPDRAIPGEVPFSGTCAVTVGGIKAHPELVRLKVDGVEVRAARGSEIEAEASISSIGQHTVVVECQFEEESDTAERTVEIVEPAWVTVHLRNFTQSGEPFVRDEGPITFTVGDREFTSTDSAVVAVLPHAEYEIFVDHADFVPLWARIADHETGELIEFHHVRDQSSPVYVDLRASIDVFKIRESDVTSIPNTAVEWADDTSPYYTVDDLRHALYHEYIPYTGGLNRITTDKVTIWPRGVDLQRARGVSAAVQKLFVVVGPNHVSNLTGGVVQSGELSYDDDRPVERPLIEIQFDEYAWHQEDVTTDGAISYSMVRLPATASLGTATATLLQAIGLRGRIGYDAVDDYVDANGIPSQFARVALKILYASPPDARF